MPLMNDLKLYCVLNGGLLKMSLPQQVEIKKYSF